MTNASNPSYFPGSPCCSKKIQRGLVLLTTLIRTIIISIPSNTKYMTENRKNQAKTRLHPSTNTYQNTIAATRLGLVSSGRGGNTGGNK